MVTPADGSSPPRVAAYLLVPCDDPAKAASLRERLVAFQRSQGLPAGLYEEQCKGHRGRPKRGLLVGRASCGDVDLVCVLALRHLAPTRARACQLVLRLGVSVVTPAGLRLDPANDVVRWVARERAEHQRQIRRGQARNRKQGKRVGAIPTGFRVAKDGEHVEPDPDEQRMLAMAFELLASGLSPTQTAVRLNEAGYHSRKGGPITHKQVTRWRLRGRDQVVCPAPTT